MLQKTEIHPSWHPLVDCALTEMDPKYIKWLESDPDWLPGQADLFRAFSIPLAQTRYILFGESPYPREQSANGYAFWDAAVEDLWSKSGLSVAVNRATSLRNFIKMLLLAEQELSADNLSQDAIAALDKSRFVTTCAELFQNLLDRGFMLLNASLVLSQKPVNHDAKAWQPFMISLLRQLHQHQPDVTLILFGKIAQRILAWQEAQAFDHIVAEHPYNISFITNRTVIQFFEQFHLLDNSQGDAYAKQRCG